MQAQDAPDFTVTTMEGETINLYDALDEGKHVVVHFFLPHCAVCTQSVPLLDSKYEEYGCNTEDIVFVNISAEAGNNTSLAEWETDNNIISPIVSGTEGNGLNPTSSYGIEGVPTVILITPEKEMIREYPVSLAEVIVPVIEQMEAIQPNPNACNSVTTAVTDADFEKLQVFPNPATDNLTLTWEDFSIERATIFDMYGRKLTDTAVDGGAVSLNLPVADFAKGTYILTTYDTKGMNGRTLFQKF